MKSLLRALQTPTYTNSGSTARDHLASERTFLAWLRTGLGFIALGIAIERFSTLEPLIKRTITSIDSAASGETPPSAHPITKSSHHDKEPRQLSMATSFSLLGATAILYGTQRYVTNLRMLQKGQYKPAFWGAGGFVGAVIGISSYGIYDTFAKER
ncbi:Putative uncharacterized protein [Taphrina deformans PYCC 5710]|uniref:DUF202 domain-containing protein n=1 Tax=Taphrina deformans (strain PYCC 5710 / ATCC 11124 / CBS 356.35 / IMI 108563 / JCM 9778 / NBRC 8474) TaxID=1097556 RepID=R4X8X5_TAPDE|nr:Putative uncharacterized protein [Taphrina deformans PYCC 5710]|eukprot:CCG80592.1 Putative uncharacterized protein [Taphrina deformans PYCC 5710]